MMKNFPTKNGLKKKTHRRQEIWQEGDGLLTIARFIRYEYSDGSLHLGAWVGRRRENSIKGFVGAMPKKTFRGNPEELICLLHQSLSQGQEDTGDKVIVIRISDHGKYATPAVALSILRVMMGLLLSPLGDIMLGELGITLRQGARNSSRNNVGRVVVILGTIAMVATIIGYIINLILTSTFIF